MQFVDTTRTEFIHLISSEANDICEKESKKTIAPEHIIGALNVRSFRVCTIFSFLKRIRMGP